MNAPSDIDVQNASDPVAERAERQMRIMAQLSELGVGLARSLCAQVSGDAPLTLRGDPALMFSRIARTVRQCIMLEAKIAEALREWMGLSSAEREQRQAAVAAKGAEALAAEEADIEDAVEIERALEGRGETEHGERVERAERSWADSYVIEDEGSFIDIVTKVCRNLGVTPDWTAWSEDAPEDMRVKPDGLARFRRAAEQSVAAGLTVHTPPQRGPPAG